MIALHRLGHAGETFHLNPDLIATVETTPDTVLHLTTGTRMLVAESAEEVVEAVREWRASILSNAVRGLPRRSMPLTLVRGSSGTPHPIAGDEPA